MSTYEQKRPHVPKFGDWNNKAGNIPYTVVFDKARKGKLKDGVKIMNPNDPEENPEAFTVVEKKKVKEGLVKIKIPIVAGENGEYSLESETIAPQSSHIGSLSHRRHKFDEAELFVCSEKMSFKSNNSSHKLQQQRKQRLLERSRKQSMDSLTRKTGSTGHHHKHSSISDIDMIASAFLTSWRGSKAATVASKVKDNKNHPGLSSSGSTLKDSFKFTSFLIVTAFWCSTYGVGTFRRPSSGPSADEAPG
ncbi:hypothetical protein ACLB2K_072636 [Fragaria x ananassa]